MKNVIFAFFLLCAFSSCYYDNAEDLYPDTGCDTDSVTYSLTVLPIIQDNCYVCHDAATNTSGITLEGYNNILTYAMNGSLMGVITHAPGYPAMPQGAAMLSACNIDKIEKWILDGAPDN